MYLQLPRILIVDHFDSYTLNLLSLLHPADAPGCSDADVSRTHADELASRIADRVVVLPHTHPLLAPDAFHQHVRPHIDAIIMSPGPGSPDKATDFGAAETLLKQQNLDLPVLGVCLGHQGLSVAFGGRVIRAISVRHGLQSKLKISAPSSSKASILDGVPQDSLVVRYNSLVVDPDTLPDCFEVTAWSFDQVSSAPPPKPGNTKKRSQAIPLRAVSEVDAPLKHRHVTCLSRSPSTVPVSSRCTSVHLSEAGEMTLSDATSVDNMPQADDSPASELQVSPAIMALQHKAFPLYGVQFHPESIESTYGHKIMSNFLDIVRQYWQGRTSEQDAEIASEARARIHSWSSPDLRLPTQLVLAGERCLASDTKLPSVASTTATDTGKAAFTLLTRRSASLASEDMPDMVRVFDQLFRRSSAAGAVWLDSARHKDPHSRYSFMATPSFVLSYKSGSNSILVSGDDSFVSNIALAPLGSSQNDTLWSFMDELQNNLQSSIDTSISDGILQQDQGANIFRTGFAGYWGYEMKNESLQLETRAPEGGNPNGFDAEFLYCPRVLAFDHHLRQWITCALVDTASSDRQLSGHLEHVNRALEHLQSQGKSWSRWALARQEAEAWMVETLSIATHLSKSGIARRSADAAAFREAMPVLRPEMLAEDYVDQIESARELIAAGESYELCMTNQFHGTLPPLSPLASQDDTDHFELYCKLRARNPAPYSAFIRLPSLSCGAKGAEAALKRGRAILSTSPERFMRITASGAVEMKPIKGTLARAGFGPGEQHMRAGTGTIEDEHAKRGWREAQDDARRAKLAADVKERAENLMIVDLIRADLFSFCRSDSVGVPKLMRVESYETVHQLVTTVTGQLKPWVGMTEAIRRCFPPGSMTGAPKRRSVQLLERLELNLADAERDDDLRARRGIYSGALGWMGCDGAADLSVVIRTLIADGDKLSIGAGGAITYLSDAKNEWQEVLDKVSALATIDL